MIILFTLIVAFLAAWIDSKTNETIVVALLVTSSMVLGMLIGGITG